MTTELETLRMSVALGRLENAALRAHLMAEKGHVPDPAWAYAITRSINPWLHDDGLHEDFSEAFRVDAGQVRDVISALVSGRIKSSMGVEEVLGTNVPNVKIVAGQVLRYLYLAGFQPEDEKPLSELGLTSDAGFAFDEFQPNEINVF